MTERQRSNWYQEWFGRDYLKVYAHRNAHMAELEVARVLGALDLEAGSRVLDLACGGGRHLEFLLKAGLDAIGADLSAELLRAANARVSQFGPRLVRCDMLNLPMAAGAFDAVFCFFTSFGYFQDDRDNQLVLENIGRLLKPGGLFVFDYLNSDKVASCIKCETKREVEGTSIVERRRFAPETGRIEKEIVLNDDAGERIYRESVRAYCLAELKKMFILAGLDVDMVWGDFDGGSFHPDSDRLIIMARRTGLAISLSA